MLTGVTVTEAKAGFEISDTTNNVGKSSSFTTTSQINLNLLIEVNGMIEFDSLMVWVPKITDSTGFTYILR